jgi:hypothetical protein
MWVQFIIKTEEFLGPYLITIAFVVSGYAGVLQLRWMMSYPSVKHALRNYIICGLILVGMTFTLMLLNYVVEVSTKAAISSPTATRH